MRRGLSVSSLCCVTLVVVQFPGSGQVGGAPIALHLVRGHDVDSLCPGREVVDEEAEALQHAAGTDDSLVEQPIDVLGAQLEVPGGRQAVGHVDEEVVRGEVEVALRIHRPKRDVDGRLGLKRLASVQVRQSRSGRDGAVVRQIHDVGIVDRRDVERVLLARGRRAEAAVLAAPLSANASFRLNLAATLPVDRQAEVREVLDPAGHVDEPLVVRVHEPGLSVGREVVAAPVPRGQRPEARESVGAGGEALGWLAAPRSRTAHRPG